MISELIPHREESVSINNNIQCSIVSSASAHTLHRTQPVSSTKSLSTYLTENTVSIM